MSDDPVVEAVRSALTDAEPDVWWVGDLALAVVKAVRRALAAELAAMPVHVDREDGNPWIHRDHAIDLVKGEA